MRGMQKIIFVLFYCSTYLSSLLFSAELVPIPTDIQVDDKKVHLGKKLFTDPILSKDKVFTCMTCHDLHVNGADKVAYTKI